MVWWSFDRKQCALIFDIYSCKLAHSHTHTHTHTHTIRSKRDSSGARQAAVASPPKPLPEHLADAKVGDLFKVTEDFNNPDGNDGVLLVKRGDIVELVETSDLWWWMRRDFEEGWVLPDVIAPVGSVSKGKDAPAPPPAAAKAALAPNPFSNGVTKKISSPDISAVFNPFEVQAPVTVRLNFRHQSLWPL